MKKGPISFKIVLDRHDCVILDTIETDVCIITDVTKLLLLWLNTPRGRACIFVERQGGGNFAIKFTYRKRVWIRRLVDDNDFLAALTQIASNLAEKTQIVKAPLSSRYVVVRF